MPADILSVYRKTSENMKQTIDSLKKSKLFSDQCLAKYEDLNCNPVYCSADENNLLVENDQEDCEDFMKNW